MTCDEVVAWLKASATEKDRGGLAHNGIPDEHALGVPIGTQTQMECADGRDQGRRGDGGLW